MIAHALATLAGRIRRARALIEAPRDAWLLCRMATWAVVLPVLKRVVRLSTLARLMWTPGDRRGDPETAKVIALSRVLTRAAGIGRAQGVCYERSLLAYRFLSQRGADPELVVAAKSDGGEISGHAWVAIGGVAVGEPDTIGEFVPIVSYGPRGRPCERQPA